LSIGYIVRPRADRDIDDLADSISEHSNLDNALDFLAEVYVTFSLLASQPEMGWPSKMSAPQLKSARTFRVSDRLSDFLIFYQPHASGVEILRVVHGARDLPALFSQPGAFD